VHRLIAVHRGGGTSGGSNRTETRSFRTPHFLAYRHTLVTRASVTLSAAICRVQQLPSSNRIGRDGSHGEKGETTHEIVEEEDKDRERKGNKRNEEEETLRPSNINGSNGVE